MCVRAYAHPPPTNILLSHTYCQCCYNWGNCRKTLILLTMTLWRHTIQTSSIDDGELTKWFEVKTGVKQVCIFSPTLFALYLENFLSYFLNNIGGGHRISGQMIHHLDFANNIIMVRPLEEYNQEATTNLYTTATKWRWKLNKQKDQTNWTIKN